MHKAVNIVLNVTFLVGGIILLAYAINWPAALGAACLAIYCKG